MEYGLVFTYALTALGCIWGLRTPVLGACVYFALSILKPTALWFWSVPFYRYTYYVAICTLIGWLISGCGRKRHMGRCSLALTCLIGFAVWSWISGMTSPVSTVIDNPYIRYHCQKITNDMLMVIVAVTLISRFRELRIFTYAIVLSAGYLAYEMNYAYVIQDWNRIWTREFAGIDNNGMAMIFAMIVPMAIGLGAAEKKWRWKALAWWSIPMNIHAVEFSQSRTGMLGLWASVPFIAWLMPNKLKSIAMLVIVIIGGLAMAGPSVQKRFSSIFLDKDVRDASANSRYTTWAAGWKCMKDHPLHGVGPRCFNAVAKQYGLTKGKSIHNLFLQVGADLGFPGMAILVGIYLGTMWAMIAGRKWLATTSPWYPYWVAGVVSGLAACTMSSQFIGMERVEMPYYLCTIGLAAVKVVHAEQRAAVREDRTVFAQAPHPPPLPILPAT